MLSDSSPSIRAIFTATKPLHDTVKDLRDRVRALETALNSIHLQRTGHTHPLLSTAGFDNGDQDQLKNVESSHEKQNPMQKIAWVRGRDGSHRIAAADGKIWITQVGHFIFPTIQDVD
jgi:DNA polymerase III epsilon subunit-like protein